MRNSIPAVLVLLFFIDIIHPLCSKENVPTMIDVSFMSICDSTEQKYVLLLPASFKADVSHDVLIALHGHGSDRWQFVKEQRDECRASRDIAAKHNMIYISPDYRAKTSWMGPKAEADVVQIIMEFKKKYRVSKLFICGGSMGGTASLVFAVLHPELIDGVMSMNGTANLLKYENFQSAIIESFGGTKEQIPLEYKKRSAEYWPEKLTMPIGLALSGKDTIVPPQSVLRLVNVLESIGHRNIKLIYRPSMGHTTKYDDAKAILEFILMNSNPIVQKPIVKQISTSKMK